MNASHVGSETSKCRWDGSTPPINATGADRGGAQPGPEGVGCANLTPRQVFALLRYLEADLVRRAGRELTRLSASADAASERAGGPAGCTDAFEALAWLEQAAARKATGAEQPVEPVAVAIESRVVACIESARKAWSPHHAYSLSTEQWEFLRKLFALDGVALRVAPQIRQLEADIAYERLVRDECWVALEAAGVMVGFGEGRATTIPAGIRVLAEQRDRHNDAPATLAPSPADDDLSGLRGKAIDAAFDRLVAAGIPRDPGCIGELEVAIGKLIDQRDQVAHEREKYRLRVDALCAERSKFLELLAAARAVRRCEADPSGNPLHPVSLRLCKAMDALADIEFDHIANTATGPRVEAPAQQAEVKS